MWRKQFTVGRTRTREKGGKTRTATHTSKEESESEREKETKQIISSPVRLSFPSRRRFLFSALKEDMKHLDRSATPRQHRASPLSLSYPVRAAGFAAPSFLFFSLLFSSPLSLPLPSSSLSSIYISPPKVYYFPFHCSTFDVDTTTPVTRSFPQAKKSQQLSWRQPCLHSTTFFIYSTTSFCREQILFFFTGDGPNDKSSEGSSHLSAHQLALRRPDDDGPRTLLSNGGRVVEYHKPKEIKNRGSRRKSESRFHARTTLVFLLNAFFLSRSPAYMDISLSFSLGAKEERGKKIEERKKRKRLGEKRQTGSFHISWARIAHRTPLVPKWMANFENIFAMSLCV